MNLPNVFQNKSLNIDSNNQQELFYGSEKKKVTSTKKGDITKKIKDIFSSTKYVYKLNVHIITKDKAFDTVIVGQTNQYLITYDNNLILIKDILDIQEIDS